MGGRKVKIDKGLLRNEKYTSRLAFTLLETLCLFFFYPGRGEERGREGGLIERIPQKQGY